MNSKKLLNSPDLAVDESLCGLVASQPSLTTLEGHCRVVIRSDIRDLSTTGKVTLLSGGGSGHEPSQIGFVGSGMLSAVVAGDIFASPPPNSILAALRAINSPGGTLMIVTNYTGDRLTFGIALERARRDGLRVEMVVVGDDCALPEDNRSITGRRGLCGTIFVHKIAGAMAEQGYTLEEVTRAAEEAAKSIGTVGVCVSPCCPPGRKSSFELGETEMELGLGVHGEAGYERTTIQCADVVVKTMLDRIVSQEDGYKYFTAEPVEVLKMTVERTYVGRFMTSLEMGGVSLSILKLRNEWLDHLNYPARTPAWPNNYEHTQDLTS